MCNLKISVIEDGVTRILQADAGTTVTGCHLTKLEKAFTEAAADVSAKYKKDLISSQQMLEAVASAYNSWKIFRALNALPTQERNRGDREAAADFNPQRPGAEVDDLENDLDGADNENEEEGE